MTTVVIMILCKRFANRILLTSLSVLHIYEIIHETFVKIGPNLMVDLIWLT